MLVDAAQIRSTRETAPSYADGMHSSTILLPLFLILADGVACKDDEPTGGEFGDPCGYTPKDDEQKTCAEGFGCFGYCEEKCEDDSDCQPVDGYKHECENDGLCHIYCTESNLACPQSLGTPLECGIAWCEGTS